MSAVPSWLRGLFAVLPTPMLADGELDLPSLDRVIDYHLDGGASGLVPASIAGEGDRLDEAERQLVIQRVVERTRARVPFTAIIAAVLRTDTEGALAQARMAAAWGVDGLLVKPPMGSVQTVLDHFDELGRVLDLPMIVLDYPKAGPLLPPLVIRKLVDAVPQVCGIKLEEEPTAIKMACVRVRLGSRIRIFGGLGGTHCLEELEQGADGFFTGCPHPELLVKAMTSFGAGDRAGAADAFATLRHLNQRERADPANWIQRRKEILCELAVLQCAAVR